MKRKWHLLCAILFLIIRFSPSLGASSMRMHYLQRLMPALYQRWYGVQSVTPTASMQLPNNVQKTVTLQSSLAALAQPSRLSQWQRPVFGVAAPFRGLHIGSPLLNTEDTSIVSPKVVTGDTNEELLVDKAFKDATGNMMRNLLEKHIVSTLRKDNEGRVLLHRAVEQRATPAAIAAIIDDFRYQVNAADNTGRTPLHIAAELSDIPAVEILLKYKADPSIKDQEGKTPLDIAQSQDPRNEEIIAMLYRTKAKGWLEGLLDELTWWSI